MILRLRQLKESEEGQTLVLAALFGLVLMLCVLGTVNLGRAVYDKVQLQAAADSAAYSEAAVEARVMNFTAYTNRAMVVHYASLMAATSYLSWIHFMYGGMKPLLTVLKLVPYVQVVARIVDEVLKYLVRFMDIAIGGYGPIPGLSMLLSAANIFLYAMQEGAWWAVWARLGRPVSPQAHSGDSAAHPYQAIWPDLIPLANQAVFSQARGHLTMAQDTFETAKIFLNSREDAVQQARLQMVEIANSARQPWVAYGDRYSNPSASPLARHWRWKIACIAVGDVARTELGTFAPSSSRDAWPQVWSGQRFQGVANCGWKIFKLRGRIDFFTFYAMDQMFAYQRPYKNADFKVWSPSWWQKIIVNLVVPGFSLVLKAVQASARQTLPNPSARPFFISPYVYFAPRARNSAEPGPFGRPGNFAQPDVLVGLAYEGRDYNRELGASKYYGRKFSWNGKGAGRGAADFGYTDKDWPRIPGAPLQVLHKGLNAFSAAQVYYHRPGEWREMPNLFNPLWGARLMPVMESNAFAKTGLNKIPLLGQLLRH